jgi:hypothetical protein
MVLNIVEELHVGKASGLKQFTCSTKRTKEVLTAYAKSVFRDKGIDHDYIALLTTL